MNSYLGISIGNPYYSRETIKKYINWSKVNCDQFAFLIGDDIYKYTYSVFKSLELSEAYDRVIKIGDDMEKNISRAISDENYENNCKIIRWGKLSDYDFYKNLELNLHREFVVNSNFQSDVKEQVSFNLSKKLGDLHLVDSDIPDIHKKLLYEYMLEELAGLITMSEYLDYEQEVYPGQDLFILTNIYQNHYTQIRKKLPKELKRKFISLKY